MPSDVPRDAFRCSESFNRARDTQSAVHPISLSEAQELTFGK